ncbi:toprim domain-containing protein [Achromobacter xylosoxidans]|uniref:toprim domain-containing protein n=1 Tax=Alcaligenes xylosoxydans xylosoxydans TaxID=85698 RepID=UPI00047A5DA6|nr:toprim domain-containing protein [Achromobacter xylosoxidans]QQE59181.1 toprim domain-containing protein [Achromobacter xylosoxidans]QQV12925.1 toprim domain-containing protein [Achromobacter xylosoxidans]
MNAQELSRRLADSAAAVAAHLLPGGKKHGREWKVGNVSGDAGDSLSVCISGAKAGIWSDFSAGVGGDLLDLWVATRRCDLAEAMREAKQYLGVRDDAPLKPPKREPYKRPAKPQCRAPKSRVREWLAGRGLTEETIAAFKIGEQERGDKVYAIFPYLRDGELVNTKSRNPDEKKDMLQAGGAEPCLFGWHLIDPNARMVAIFEGEIDAMTGHQVGIPSLSVNAGAGNHQWIENDWERLQQFSDIVLCYDNDEAGHKGAREVATRLGLERCRIATFGKAKDANEYLTEYKASGEDFEHCIKQARGLDPEELQQLADFMPATQAMFWPAHDAPAYPQLSFCGRAMDWWEWLPARVSVWTGINGHGKSLMLSQALIPVMQSDIPVCMFSGELTPAQQLKRLAKQITGIDRPTPAYLSAVQNWLQGRMWIFNVVGIAGLDRLLEVFAYAASRYGCGHFVIDSLMMLDVPEDGPGSMTAQKTAMRKIVSFAHATQSHVHLVAHPRKASDETKAPGKLDVAGSGHITNGADNVFSVWSAQKPPGEDTDTPDARLEVLKDRDDVGRRKISLYFNRSTGQYTLDDARRSYQYLKFSQEAR